MLAQSRVCSLNQGSIDEETSSSLLPKSYLASLFSQVSSHGACIFPEAAINSETPRPSSRSRCWSMHHQGLLQHTVDRSYAYHGHSRLEPSQVCNLVCTISNPNDTSAFPAHRNYLEDPESMEITFGLIFGGIPEAAETKIQGCPLSIPQAPSIDIFGRSTPLLLPALE